MMMPLRVAQLKRIFTNPQPSRLHGFYSETDNTFKINPQKTSKLLSEKHSEYFSETFNIRRNLHRTLEYQKKAPKDQFPIFANNKSFNEHKFLLILRTWSLKYVRIYVCMQKIKKRIGHRSSTTIQGD